MVVWSLDLVVKAIMLLGMVIVVWLLYRGGTKNGVPTNPAVECDYCRRYLGTQHEYEGIVMNGEHYCDNYCWMGSQRRDMAEGSLKHRG